MAIAFKIAADSCSTQRLILTWAGGGTVNLCETGRAPRMEPWFRLDGVGGIPPVDRVQVAALLCANHGQFSDPCLRLIIKQMRTLIKQPFLP